MSAPSEIATRVRISDPRPSHCAACFRGAEAGITFIDFDAAIDRGSLQDREGWTLAGIDDLHLCEHCVREGAEKLEFKPEVHAEDHQKIRKLELQVQHWQQYAKDLEEALGRRPIAVETRRKRAA